MEFKTEIALLTAAIALFLLSSYCYLYQPGSAFLSLDSSSYSYRLGGISLLGLGAALTATASISYSRKSKMLQ